ncbi:MAG: O-sialoglycoprotein endopeptidase [Firmicutes bacterium]|nr:O-sialoglycoprotein endopeptidase [Bacillota bacterium]
MFYGIDTSCYTTSLAVIDDQGRLLDEQRQLLAVEAGARGLRQSEAVFRHLCNLPLLSQELGKTLQGRPLLGVAATTRPRPVEGSYMPVFVVGESFGRALAATLGVPFFALSHQEGHLLAGMWSAGLDWANFLAVHVSGGTTEVLRVSMAEQMVVTELGGSADLHAGQFIDRVGVSLGLPFPAGPYLEKLAADGDRGDCLQVPISVAGLRISFSGPESYVQRELVKGDYLPAAVARGVERCVSETLCRLVQNARQASGLERVLFVGGVAANAYIRAHLTENLGGVAVSFASPSLAADNAVGAALYAWQRVRCNHNI